MLWNRREVLRMGGALAAPLLLPYPLIETATAMQESAAPPGRETHWETLVCFFDGCEDVNPEWKARRAEAHLYYQLRIRLHDDRLAGRFVRSRYDDRGALWYCCYLDDLLKKRAGKRLPWAI